MLSMVISIFELRSGLDMPSTIVELYEIASQAMLERGEVTLTVPHLTELLQTVFFQAHVAQVAQTAITWEDTYLPPSLTISHLLPPSLSGSSARSRTCSSNAPRSS